MTDARDSKSRGGNTMSVRVRPSAPAFLPNLRFTSVGAHLRMGLLLPLILSLSKDGWHGHFFKGKYLMTIHNCIFCKIIAREIPSTVILETDTIIVIKDINPKAPIHYLIIPKKHVSDIQSLRKEDLSIASDIFCAAQQLSSTLSEPQAFRLINNNGADVGQIIFHIHFHFLAGARIPHF